MKRFNLKSFVAGILVCLFAIYLIPVARAVSEYVCTLAEYPILINGEKYSGTDPILNYDGATYVPLKGVLETAGLTVTWNDELKQVEVINMSTETTTALTDETTKTMAQQARDGEIPETITTPDGVTANCLTDGYYISKNAFSDVYEDTEFQLKARPANDAAIWAIYKNNVIIYDNVILLNEIWIEYNYYCNTILPLLK